MMTAPTLHLPCEAFAAKPGVLEELPLRGKLILRGDAHTQAFSAAVAGVLGCSLPETHDTPVRFGEHTLYRLGPDEWQITNTASADPPAPALHAALESVHHALVDVSDYYTTLRLAGDQAHEWLTRGCPLDLHPRAFATDRFAQTRFAHAAILLHKVEPAAFELQVRWSFAAYLWHYLTTVIDKGGD